MDATARPTCTVRKEVGDVPYYFMPIGVSADVLISDAQIFDSLNGVILGWICLIFLPTWRHTK